MKNYKTIISTVIASFFCISLSFDSNGFTAEEEKWLNADDDTDTSSVNEGRLTFISKPENKKILHSTNKITITQNSIDNGWVGLHQCYRYLDKLEQLEITYKYRFMKNLSIVSRNNIRSAKIVKQNIELKNIKDDAELCVTADVRIFYQNKDLSFSLVNGPYHRRFLDGFYPYHVTLDIRYPSDKLLFVDSKPDKQKGFVVNQFDNRLEIDTYFEGILNTEIRFKLLK